MLIGPSSSAQKHTECATHSPPSPSEDKQQGCQLQYVERTPKINASASVTLVLPYKMNQQGDQVSVSDDSKTKQLVLLNNNLQAQSSQLHCRSTAVSCTALCKQTCNGKHTCNVWNTIFCRLTALFTMLMQQS